MNRTEFMDLLRYYFRKVDEAELAEILSDYDAHFEEGLASGLSEEEICRELGSPKAIYEMYLHEDMISEKDPAAETSGRAADKLSDAAEKLTDAAGKLAGGAGVIAQKAQKTWDTSIRPELPDAAASASSFVLKLLTWACYAVAVLVLACTALIVYLCLTLIPGPGELPPIMGPGGVLMPPFPGLSRITIAGIGSTGFFAGLALFFTGRELSRHGRGKSDPPASGKDKKTSPAPKDETPASPSFPAVTADAAAAEK